MAKNRTIILHYHLFKNAGTSVDHILKANFKDRWVTREFGHSNSPEGNSPEVESWISAEADAVAFSSHTMMGPLPQVPGVNVISLVLLRDPIARIRSAYDFERNQTVDTSGSLLARRTDFEGYVRERLSKSGDHQCRNFHVHRLASLVPGDAPMLDRALKAVDKISVLGLVARFSDAMAALETALAAPGIPFAWEETTRNKSERSDDEISPELLELLKKENTDDIALLEKVKAQHKDAVLPR